MAQARAERSPRGPLSGGDLPKTSLDRRAFLTGAAATGAVALTAVAGGAVWYMGRRSEQIAVDTDEAASAGELEDPLQDEIAVVPESDIAAEYTMNANLYANRNTSPEPLEEYLENGDIGGLVDTFRTNTEDIPGLGENVSPGDTVEGAARGVANNVAVQIERMLNAGLHGGRVARYQHTKSNVLFVSGANADLTPAAVKGIWGLDGNKTSDSYTKQNLNDPLTDSELRGLPPFIKASDARSAVLTNYIETVRATGNVNQSFRVRVIDVVRYNNFTLGDGGDLDIYLGVTKVMAGNDGAIRQDGDEIEGKLFFAADAEWPDGFIRSNLNGGVLYGDDSYEIFDKIAATYG